MTDRIPRDLFGRSSYRDRRNADLFFAELTGESPPASGIAARHPGRTEAVPHSEQAARGQDAGPEVWSDVEAAPVHPVFGAHEAWEQDIPWGEDEPEPTVTAGRNADEIIVTRADGSRYHVLRKVRAEVLTRPGRPRLGLCRDDKRVFLRVAWCEGTQAAIDAGANIPEALRNLLDTVAGQIQQGASPADIKQTFEQAQVQPFIELDITKIGDWKIAGDVKLDIDRSGIVSTTAQVSADKGWIKVGAQYQDDGSGKRVLATVDIPLGKRTVAGKKCPKRELAVWWDAECWREEPMTISTPGYRVSEETLFLYFEYATDVLRRDPKATQDSPDVIVEILASTPKLGTAVLNKRALQRLDYVVGQGYFLDSVKGYTSPEGRRGPPPRRSGSKWEGNDELSRERAQKVLDLIKARYVNAWLGMRGLAPPRMRFPPDASLPTGVGLSEHPELDERPGVELEGSKLDRVLIRGDKKADDPRPFLDRYPEELARMTDDDRKYVTDRRVSDRKRAERLFQNLRRVEIHLVKREPLAGAVVPTTMLVHEHDCPADVIEAAERKWGSRIPFTKPDPPLCD